MWDRAIALRRAGRVPAATRAAARHIDDPEGSSARISDSTMASGPVTSRMTLVATLFQHGRAETAHDVEHFGVSSAVGRTLISASSRATACLGVPPRACRTPIIFSQLAHQPLDRASSAPTTMVSRDTPAVGRADREALNRRDCAAARRPPARLNARNSSSSRRPCRRRGRGHRRGGRGRVPIRSARRAMPPGGIIGNTFASCSITNSTSAGPGSRSAARDRFLDLRACPPASRRCRTPPRASRSPGSRWASPSSAGHGRTAATAAPCRGSRC